MNSPSENYVSSPLPRIAFVTGSTGLLGRNLVRELHGRGIGVRALARSRAKAQRQFGDLPVEIVEGDLADPAAFADHLTGVDTVFHTAAYFRESYQGGRHDAGLEQINVRGTAALLAAAYDRGVRRFVHTSSIATLKGAPGVLVDETMSRAEADADAYFRSKILSEREVDRFLETYPDFWAVHVLPGWMFGPGDLGPTSAGQLVLDFTKRKIPGILPGGFAVVDARDVAVSMITATQRGRRGERYITAGPRVSMSELCLALSRATGLPAPTRKVPLAALYAIGFASEAWARVTGNPTLLSLASVRLIAKEADQAGFDHTKSERELSVQFRNFDETLADTLTWYRTHAPELLAATPAPGR